MSDMGMHSGFTIKKFREVSSPLVDVRSPKEFNQGHWPGAINLPLFTDNEREAIGISYKKQGREKAILLGLELIGPRLPELSQSPTNCKNNTIYNNIIFTG